MSETKKTIDARRNSSKSAAPGSCGHAFKPVALPAVAAAVHAVRSGETRKPAHREIPAILRQLAFVD